MAKYFITFVLFALLALENKNIYNRLHAKSQPSVDTNGVALFMRQHQYRHHTQPDANHDPTHDHHQTHHARKHVKQHQHLNADYGEEEDLMANDSRRDAERVKRHMERQLEHREEHEKRLHQRQHQQMPVYSEETLKTMPRIWQHLKMVYDYENSDRMFGDEPAKDSFEYNDSPEIPLTIENEDFSNTHRKHTRSESEESSNVNNSQKPVDHIRCPKCESNRKVEHVSEEELTSLRIEFVKQQILEKLRLKERPNVSAVSLPKPISEGVTIEEPDDDTTKRDLDDYYARTSKKFIFLQIEKEVCRKLGSKPSMCFSFNLDDTDADNYEVSTAVLWIFKNSQHKFAKHNHTLANQKQKIVVSEVQQEMDSKYSPAVKTIAEQHVEVQDEWMKIDIEWPIKRWFANHELSHMIQITCESCDLTAMEHMISTDKDYRPFIMVDTQSRKRQPRQKRNINCTSGVTECCREKLHISFAEIGWGDWIIQPSGYDAYFCRGSCNSVASVASSSSHHSSFLQKLLNKPGYRNKHLELVPCCTAKTYSPLQLMFTDSNNTATERTFPNMIVESCGCR